MASVSVVFLLFFAISVAEVGAQLPKDSNQISLGSSLSPKSQSAASWPSPSGRFEFGFYQQGDGYAVGIWLVGRPNNIVVWAARRDDPPVTLNATVDLTKDGRLVLRTGQQGEADRLISNATDSASFVSMHDSGNFVLYNKDLDVIWQSFEFPTDTILGGQNLSTDGKLFSSLSETNRSTGRYVLVMQGDGNLVLYPADLVGAQGAYWSSKTFKPGHKYHLYLNDTGALLILNNTNLDRVMTLFGRSSSANNNSTIIYRATLDVDGIFRLYSHVYNGSFIYKPSVVWSALKDLCEVGSFCGFNSFCTLMDSQPNCLCLPGFDFVDPNQWSLGCARSFSEEGCRGGKEEAALYNITTTENMLWEDRPYFQTTMLMEDCSTSCLEDCNCEAALFKDGNCMKHKLPLRRIVRRDLQETSTAFFKVGIGSIKSRSGTIPMKPPIVTVTSKKAVVLILAVTLGFITCSCVALAISGLFIFKFRVLGYRRLLENRNLGLTEELTLRLFSYNELRRATNGFKEELGKGSFGAVYKGALYKGKKLVAVKRLEKVVEEGEREFQAEMRAIGKTHHRNLVRLLGYCTENTKRLLVYEYMSNGSLADLLFRSGTRPDWNDRVRIALDVARGILYLHEECEAPIIHCDIKPQNILMDDFWAAKISDFGLAKLLMPDQTRTFTGVRGTRGYVAPEWQNNTPISVKADIYSYGIVLLEIACCRRNMEFNVSTPEEIVLPAWVYKCFIARELDKLVGGEEVDKKALERMVMVGLWCIQDEPFLRPSMKSVVLMLEGITDISIPPCPTTYYHHLEEK